MRINNAINGREKQLKFKVILQYRVFWFRKSIVVTLNHFISPNISIVTPILFITLFSTLKGILKWTWHSGGIYLEKLPCILKVINI